MAAEESVLKNVRRGMRANIASQGEVQRTKYAKGRDEMETAKPGFGHIYMCRCSYIHEMHHTESMTWIRSEATIKDTENRIRYMSE